MASSNTKQTLNPNCKAGQVDRELVIDGDRAVEQVMQGTTSTATKVSHGEFELVQQSKRFVPGSLVGIKDIDFVGRSEAETP